MKQNHARQIVSALGSDAIEARVGVGRHSIRAAKLAGVFPASWYVAVRDLCMSAGISCPLDAFSWRGCQDGTCGHVQCASKQAVEP